MPTEKKNQPSYRNADWERRAPALKVARDVSGGTAVMRAAKTTYLPMEKREVQAAYDARLARTVFFDAYNRTVQSLVGCVFKDEVTIGEDVPSEIATQLEDVDLCGNHLDVFAKKLFVDQFEGCAFILVDMEPALVGPVTLADERNSGRRPYWVGYKADAAVNWRTERIKGEQQFTQITFEECSVEPDGEYGEKKVTRYRVFKLEGGLVTWQLWKVDEEKGETDEGRYIDDGSGTTTLTRIPVAVVGDVKSMPPLLGLAYLNISHWQNVSDQENILHVTRVPMLVRIGAKGDQKEVQVGVTSTLDAPTDGDFKWLEVSANGAMEVGRTHLLDIENRMAMMGLAQLAAKEVERTATEVNEDYNAAYSELSTMARSLKDGIELALSFHAEYLSVDEGGSIELGVAETQLVLTPQHFQALLAANQANRFPTSALLQAALHLMQQAGVLAEDDDVLKDWQTEIDDQQASADANALREQAAAGARGINDNVRRFIGAA